MRVYAFAPRGTPIDKAKRLALAEGFDCDSLQSLIRFGQDTLRAIPCLHATMPGARSTVFWLVAESGRLSNVLIDQRK